MLSQQGVALPMFVAGFGIQTPYGISLPPGGRIAAFVRSTTPQGIDDPFIYQNCYPTLNQALSKCRSGYGDTVVVLPGHSENISTADQMSALLPGTRIIGAGWGGLMPTFRWTATAATFLLDVANVVLQGLRLRMEGANGVVAPITASAADCGIIECDIETSSGASALATTPITVATGAARFAFWKNRMRGLAAGVCTDGISVTGDVDGVSIGENFMLFASGTATGLIRVSGAATNLILHANKMFNITASSVNTVVLNNAGITALATYNLSGVLTNGTPPAGGILVTSAASFMPVENYTTDASGASGFLDPAVST